MAVQIESRGQILDFLDVLRRRAWQILLPAVFVLVIGSCLAAIIPRKFLAVSQLELRQVGPISVGREGQNAQFQVMAPARIKKVVEDLKSPMYLALSESDRRDFLRTIAKNLRVTWAAPGSQSSIFITIAYTHVNRGWAGTFLKALRDDWKEDVLELDRNKLKDEKLRLGLERDKLEKRYHKEEQDLADLKRTKGISATQPIPGSPGQRSEDPDYDRLQTAKSQLFQVNVTLGKARATKAVLEKRLAEMPEKVSREQAIAGVGHEKEIAGLETEILGLREKLRSYGTAHSKYQLILNKIATLEQRQAELEGLSTRGELRSLALENPERAKVRQEIAAKQDEIAEAEETSKILADTITETERSVSDLHDTYREVRERGEKIQRLQAELLDTDRRYQDKVQQVQLTEGPLANPFSILEEISVPPKPTEPNPMIIVAFSLVAGLGLGVGLAVLFEYSKSCFRSVYDISRVMVVPVLGNINTIVTRRESRLKTARRIVVATASALILGSLAFVTWAWSAESALLSPALRNAIENLRSALN